MELLLWASRDSVVGIATVPRVGRSGDRILVGARGFFFSQKRPERLRGLPSFLVKVSWVSVLGIKRPEHEVDHPPASSAPMACYTSAPSVCLHWVDREKLYISLHME
jgi:hypothetical protein